MQVTSHKINRLLVFPFLLKNILRTVFFSFFALLTFPRKHLHSVLLPAERKKYKMVLQYKMIKCQWQWHWIWCLPFAPLPLPASRMLGVHIFGHFRLPFEFNLFASESFFLPSYLWHLSFHWRFFLIPSLSLSLSFAFFLFLFLFCDFSPSLNSFLLVLLRCSLSSWTIVFFILYILRRDSLV